MLNIQREIYSLWRKMSSLVGTMNLSVQPPSGECISYCNSQPFLTKMLHVYCSFTRDQFKPMPCECNNAMNNGGHSNCDDTTLFSSESLMMIWESIGLTNKNLKFGIHAHRWFYMSNQNFTFISYLDWNGIDSTNHRWSLNRLDPHNPVCNFVIWILQGLPAGSSLVFTFYS